MGGCLYGLGGRSIVLAGSKGEDGEGGGGVAHELGLHAAFGIGLVERSGVPVAFGVLLGFQPFSSFGEGFVIGFKAGFLQQESGESGGVGVGAGLLWRFVVRMPGAEGGEGPGAVGLLVLDGFVEDGFALGFGEESGEAGGSPGQHESVLEGLVGLVCSQVLDEGLDFGAFVLGRRKANGEGGDGGSVEDGLGLFPGLEVKDVPMPCAFVFAFAKLEGPEAVEGLGGIGLLGKK